MSTISGRASDANPTDLPSLSAPLRDAVRWEDPEDIRLWIAALRAASDEGLGAGEDAARPKRNRVLSHAEARRRIAVGEQRIANLLDSGERGLEKPSQVDA
jgi:hypothetical protein